MGRGKHKNKSHSEKRKAYLTRRARPDYPKGGYGGSHIPYANIERK